MKKQHWEGGEGTKEGERKGDRKKEIPLLGPNIILHRFHLHKPTAAAAKSLQSCPTLCDPIDGSPPGSSVPGTLQARILECIAISFSNVFRAGWGVLKRKINS